MKRKKIKGGEVREVKVDRKSKLPRNINNLNKRFGIISKYIIICERCNFKYKIDCKCIGRCPNCGFKPDCNQKGE
jgi:hypothetical protein